MKKIGEGVCGDVFLKDNIAIKSIPLKKINDKKLTRNFGIPYMLKLKNIKKYEDNKGTWNPGINDTNELIILNQLQEMKINNNNIVPIINKFYIKNKKIIIEMEYFENNVEEYIRNNDISNKEFKLILFNMWKIIENINNNGIIHLDTHGRNFLINKNNKIVIIDFGHSISNIFDYTDEYYIKLLNNKYIDLAINILHFHPNYLNKSFKSSYILEELYDKSLKIFLNVFENKNYIIDFDLYQDAFNLLRIDDDDTLEV